MRGTLKVAAWAAVFLACAAVGALVAARSDPFPPGVEDPGATSPTPSAPSQSWLLRLRSDSRHDEVVGGGCTTRWRGRVVMTVDANDHLQGSGQADLEGTLVCDFPNAQVQVRSLNLFLHGSRHGDRFVFRLGEQSRVPIGARDYGGFTNTVLKAPLFTIAARDGATVTVHRTRADETGRGSFLSTTVFTLGCEAACR